MFTPDSVPVNNEMIKQLYNVIRACNGKRCRRYRPSYSLLSLSLEITLNLQNKALPSVNTSKVGKMKINPLMDIADPCLEISLIIVPLQS